MGRARDRLSARPTQVRRSLPPDFTLTVVKAECSVVRLQVFCAHLLDGLRQLAMEKLSMKREKLAEDDLTDSLMGEVEPLSDPAEDATTHELLDTFSRVASAEPNRSLKNGEFEFSSDHGGHRRQLLTALA